MLTLRYRKSLACVKIFADVDVKHSAPLAHRELSDEVQESIGRGCADGIIYRCGYGKQTSVEDLKRAKAAARGTPVLVGSGVDVTNVTSVIRSADGLIIGTALKSEGISANPVDPERVRRFMDMVRDVPLD